MVGAAWNGDYSQTVYAANPQLERGGESFKGAKPSLVKGLKTLG